MAKKNTAKAVAYLRTSSAANVGTDKDSDKRQRRAIAAYANVRGSISCRSFTMLPSLAPM
jgi:hypothetical protein